MGLYILAAILLLPLVEIVVFIQIGGMIGALPTIILTVLTAIAGTMLLRQQGLSLLGRLQSEMNAGRIPGTDIMHGAMIVLAGVLLLIPGFVTDAFGLLLFIPLVREAIVRFLVARENVIISGSSSRNSKKPDIVDLDETDWSRKETHGSNNPKYISPWKNDRDDA